VELLVTDKVELLDYDDLTRLKVRQPEGVDAAAVLARTGIGSYKSSLEVLVRIDWLREVGRELCADDWPERFDAMVAFARERGWVDQSGNSLLAHLERDGKASNAPERPATGGLL
jgi:hypothetical protein